MTMPHPSSPDSSSSPSRDAAEALANWLKVESFQPVLAHQRTDVLRRLARGPIRVSDLAEEIDLDIQHISRYLGPMREIGLVVFEKHGRDYVYRLSDDVRVTREGEHILLSMGHDPCEMCLRIGDKVTDLSPRGPITRPAVDRDGSRRGHRKRAA